MHEFNYNFLKEKQWDKEILGYIGLIHEYKGKQQLYLQQKPFELDRLVELAKIQSTESSNAIEGIVTTNQRLKQLMDEIDVNKKFLVIVPFLKWYTRVLNICQLQQT